MMMPDRLAGVAIDCWGAEWTLGGPAATRPPVRWSAEPDQPTDVSGLAEAKPGPELAGLLAETDPADVADARLVDVITAAERLARWASAMQVEAVAELSRRPTYATDRDDVDELRSAGCEVALALKLAPTTGETRVFEARQLVEEFPATLSALRAGQIDYRRASAFLEGVVGLDPAKAHGVEARVLATAGERTIGQHRRAIERAVLHVDPNDAEDRHIAAARHRAVGFVPLPCAMGRVVADLTADGMATVRAALDAAAAGMKAGRPADGRTMEQLRADALVDMARLSLESGWLAGVDGKLRLGSTQGRRPHIQVTVPFSTLIGIDERPAELDGYGPIPAFVARRIAADGVWRRLLTDPASGALLDYGTTRYEPPTDLREFVIARDQTCIMPVCSQPARRCQLDHTISYPDGPTSADNLGPPCRPDHNLKTHARWRLQQPDPGHFVWTTPAGRIYHREPNAVGPIVEPPDDDEDP